MADTPEIFDVIVTLNLYGDILSLILPSSDPQTRTPVILPVPSHRASTFPSIEGAVYGLNHIG
jgi:hypothetical protein